MSDESNDIEEFENFPTFVADSAYVHIIEGFVSLLFFLIKSIPQYDAAGKFKNQVKSKTEFIGEIRLSIHDAEELMKNLQETLAQYHVHALLPFDRDMWKVPDDRIRSGLLVKVKSDVKESEALSAILNTLMDKLPAEGKAKVMDIVTQCVHDHIEEFRKIAIDYGVAFEISE